VEQIRIRWPGIRRGRPCHEVFPPDPRDSDVVRAKALARAGGRAETTTTPLSELPPKETS